MIEECLCGRNVTIPVRTHSMMFKYLLRWFLSPLPLPFSHGAFCSFPVLLTLAREASTSVHYEGPGTSNYWLTRWLADWPIEPQKCAALPHFPLGSYWKNSLGTTGLWPAQERTRPHPSKPIRLLCSCHHPAPRGRSLFFTSLKQQANFDTSC